MRKLFNPRVISAPLPDDMPIRLPSKDALIAEIARAATELQWALDRQRTTWARLARIKAELAGRAIEFIDNERPYKLAVGDVQWWRGEVSSRSNALSGLLALAAAMGVSLKPDDRFAWPNPTNDELRNRDL